ncbi:translocation and assembly module TamB [Oceanisphaera litoralis]|uniref:autotransporter assembly complex protein TamB n=1 Tax=Oceanisphaera litoralis TaxID=225144 RepID=UPI00195D9154|nr:translocation/assembly module TamB domain-containing protein [Oceanisphaera litoralis]MBM7457134.1 translocation and assembly module TamB [Oceanisphaera litoralis]
MNLMRLFSGLVVALCLLLMLLFSLLFTQLGNQWLWGLAKQQVPGLDGTLVSGQLGRGWQFDELSYEQDSLAFSARQVTIDWQLGKLLERRFWLRQLVAEDIEVTIRTLPPAKEEAPAEPPGQITPPLRLDLDDIRADRVKISLPGQTIAWQSLQLAVHWDADAMVITGPKMQGLTLTLNPGDEAAPTGDKNAAAVSSPLILPEVILPFPVRLQGFSLTDSRLIQGGQIRALKALALDLEGQDSEVNILTAELDHELATVTLGGHITLSEDYPLELAVNATLHQPLLDGQLAGQTLALALSDSVQRLKGELTLGGVVEANASLTAQPLDPALPFDISLDWQRLGWPLTDPQWQLKQGKLRLKGRLADYQVSLQAEGQGPELPPIGIRLAAKGDLQGARLSPLTLTLPQGEAKLTGALGWAGGIDWQGLLALSEVDPGAFVTGLDGRLNGELDTRFVLNGKQWELNARPDIHGQLRDYPLLLKGEVVLDQALQGSINQLRLINGNNQLTVNGRITDRWQLDGVLKAPELAVYAPGLSGDLAGDIRVRGELAAPQIEASLTGGRAGFNDTLARNIRLQARATLGDAISGDVRLTVDRIQAGEMQFKQLLLTGKGNEAAHRLELNVAGDPLAAELRLDGSLDQDAWRGRLSRAVLDTPFERWALQQEVAMTWREQRFRADPHCWRSGEASLCFDALTAGAKEGQGGVNIRDLDLARLEPFFPRDFAWEAILGGRVDLRWKDGAPTLNANISTTPGTFVSGDTRLDYQTLSLTSEMMDNRLQSSLAFRSTQLGRLALDANVADLKGRRALSGNLSIEQLKLDWLAPLLPEVARLQGTLAGRARLEGTLQAPLLFGDISLSGGEVDTYSDMVQVRDFSTRLEIRGTNATINGRLRVGDGPLNISGELDWRQLPVSGEIRLKGIELEAGYPGMGRVRVSPDLQIGLGEQATVRGEILIPWARIEVKELPESAVSRSADVVIVQASGIIPEQAPKLPLDIRITVRLTEDVRLEAFGLDTRLEGQLRIVQRPKRSMRANGEIRLIDGRFRAYGQNLQIRDGSILFSGPLDQPNLRVEAIRNPSSLSDSSIIVGVRVSGSAAQPKVEVFSDPAMPQVEQLSYLLRGRGLEGGGESDGNALVQSMLLGAGVGKIGGLVTNVGEALGLQDVSLDTGGSGDETEVNISAYVLPGLQIGYGVGVFSAIGELRLRYELLPRLYLQATSGLSQAIDIFYRFEF